MPFPANAYRATSVRTHSSIVRALLTLIGIPLGLFFLFAVLNAVRSPDTTTAPPVHAPAPATVPAPATPQPDASTPGATVPDGSYVNDNYQVPAPDPNPPDLPAPRTWDDIDAYLDANPLYQVSAPVPVRCDITQIDLTQASQSQLQSHFSDLTACLMRVWGPTLAQAGFQAVRPTVTIYDGTVQTACGRMTDDNAAYCGADQQVYYGENLPQDLPRSLRSAPFVVDSIIAHEFGHAVQARTGIFVSATALEQTDEDNKDDASANDTSRRVEQQADCFAGEFLHSVTQSTGLTPDDAATIESLFYSIGDDQLSGDPTIDGDHGMGANRQAWVAAGMTTPALSTCNTFTASSSSVR